MAAPGLDHLGFHKYRFPLVRGHQSPLLLLLEVFLLGQQYFLGVHTRLQGERKQQDDLHPLWRLPALGCQAPFFHLLATLWQAPLVTRGLNLTLAMTFCLKISEFAK